MKGIRDDGVDKRFKKRIQQILGELNELTKENWEYKKLIKKELENSMKSFK